MNFINKYKKEILVISLIFPLIINILCMMMFSLEFKYSILFILTNFYYLLIFFTFLILKNLKQKKIARTPFQFIKRLNTTGDKNYWDEFQKPLRHLTGVEIGVATGKNALSIYNYLNIKKLYLIDPWKLYIDEISNHEVENQDYHDDLYAKVKTMFKDHPKVEIIRDKSFNASKNFKNESLDFIYIDGDHAYDAVKSDLNTWYPKLKTYGVMCGDDYGHISGTGVIKAVNEFAYQNKVVIHYGEDNQFWFVKV